MRNFKSPKIFPKKCFLVIENIQKLLCFENIESNRARMFVYKRELIATLKLIEREGQNEEASKKKAVRKLHGSHFIFIMLAS